MVEKPTENEILNQYLLTVIEVIAMLLLWLVPRSLTFSLNRRHGPPENLLGLLRYLLQPVLVLVLTWLVVVVLRAQGDLASWLDTHADHLHSRGRAGNGRCPGC